MAHIRGVSLALTLLLAAACSIPGLWSFSEQSSPEDLDGCFAVLDALLDPAEIEKMRSGTEAEMGQYYFGLGMWMRNEWGLWSGSELQRWFREKGIFHPDDMSGIILTSYWRYLNDAPIELDEQIASYQKYWLEHAVSRKMSCPKCEEDLIQRMSGRDLDPIHDTDFVHVYSCKNGHACFFHYQRGLYEPDSATARRLLDSLLPDVE